MSYLWSSILLESRPCWPLQGTLLISSPSNAGRLSTYHSISLPRVSASARRRFLLEVRRGLVGIVTYVTYSTTSSCGLHVKIFQPFFVVRENQAVKLRSIRRVVYVLKNGIHPLVSGSHYLMISSTTELYMLLACSSLDTMVGSPLS